MAEATESDTHQQVRGTGGDNTVSPATSFTLSRRTATVAATRHNASWSTSFTITTRRQR